MTFAVVESSSGYPGQFARHSPEVRRLLHLIGHGGSSRLECSRSPSVWVTWHKRASDICIACHSGGEGVGTPQASRGPWVTPYVAGPVGGGDTPPLADGFGEARRARGAEDAVGAESPFRGTGYKLHALTSAEGFSHRQMF